MDHAKVGKYQKGEIIVQQGKAQRALYKILSGDVALYVNHGTPNEYFAGTLSAPQCFGEMMVLVGQPSQYTVLAQSDAAVLCVPEEALLPFIQNDAQDALVIMKTLARNLTLTNVNFNILLNEFRTMSKAVQVDGAVIGQMLDRHEAMHKKTLAVPGKKKRLCRSK